MSLDPNWWLNCDKQTTLQNWWLNCSEPWRMLLFVRSKDASKRKLRLFFSACCRRIWHLLDDERSRKAVEAAEQLAEGQVGHEVLERAASDAADAYIPLGAAFDARLGDPNWCHLNPLESGERTRCERAYLDAFQNALVTGPRPTGYYASASAGCAAYITSSGGLDEDASAFAASAVDFATIPGFEAAYGSGNNLNEYAAHRLLLFDIFGPLLFRSVPIDSGWLTWNDATVVKLAHAIYDERELPSGHLDNGRLGILADALKEVGCTDADILSHCRQLGEHVRGCWVLDLLLGNM